MSTFNPYGWLETFQGCDTGFDDCELYAISLIPKSVLTKEAELMQTKWFDYRRLHPTIATLLFIHCYNKAYKGFIRIARDCGMAEGIKAYKGSPLKMLESKEGKVIWKARQVFDQLGIRYDFALRYIMNHYLECGWLKNAPRPHHLTNEDVLVGLMLAWEEEQKRAVQQALDPFYKTENFLGCPDQLAYEAMVIAQIKQRRRRADALHNAIYIDRTIRFEAALQHFSSTEVEEAIELAVSI